MTCGIHIVVHDSNTNSILINPHAALQNHIVILWFLPDFKDYFKSHLMVDSYPWLEWDGGPIIIFYLNLNLNFDLSHHLTWIYIICWQMRKLSHSDGNSSHSMKFGRVWVFLTVRDVGSTCFRHPNSPTKIFLFLSKL